MNKKILVFLLATVILASVHLAGAQQAKVHRIGFLYPASLTDPSVEAFRQGLRDLGYVEGKNIVVEYRSAEGRSERYPDLAAELVRLNVDLIVAGGTAGVRPVKQATSTIPIVMTNVGDPVEQGFVASLARPGGNITGLTSASPDLSGKRLELLKEAVRGVTRVAVLWDPRDPGNAVNFKQTEAAARALSVQLQSL